MRTTQKNTITVAALGAILFFSGVLIGQSFKSAEAGHVSGCRGYSSSINTINVTCDATWKEIGNSFPSDSTIVINNGDGSYTVNADIAVREGVKLTLESGDWIKITGENGLIVYGLLDSNGAKVTSWNSTLNSIVENPDPRAYVRFRGGDGGLIENTEFAYLGFACSGCSYKRGFSMETYSGLGTHDVTIRGGSFHHNYYAFYSNGAYNIVLDGSEWHDNFQYSIDPHTGTHDMQIINNHLYNNSGGAGIICSLDCYNILIENNVVHDGKYQFQTGIHLSRNMTNSIVRNNEVYNVQTGIAVSESPNNEITGNNFHDVYRGIYFLNPVTPDDGVTQNNFAHGNIISSANYGIMSVRSPGDTVANNTIANASVGTEYFLNYGSNLTIENQAFNNDQIRGAGSGDSNTITIQNSGLIEVDGEMIHSSCNPYTAELFNQSIYVSGGVS